MADLEIQLDKSNEFWDKRYKEDGYRYGAEPNEFLKKQLAGMTPGKILFPCEGEGRNAVYAALVGWDVHAMDFSEAGKTKALALASEKNVSIQYDVADIATFTSEPSTYDAIGLIFAHLPPDLRSVAYKKLVGYLKPGGTVILEMFSKKQLGRSSGGPQRLDMLWSKEEVLEIFAGLTVVQLEEVETELKEGPHHDGKASTVRFIGQKP
mmetsp:Transcript_13947/g.32369  ORF Transcript_13947/g.32369 Transcript_13947/m.32369 type:complete len:209 (+) Transcript_13947:95-721(+)|eukprot:CAMPEP_0116826394 /NCGR_PEP_ID=MMETSP0418-20121206/2504_1 /TAXON_ID=1158023 /ORGANISM="Astrosyne radiata, Strain 13vi08-1A" /LENGTH=208 /DNA_ID=CAMNT_0004455023 /DNA_START=60 /DNA_END=686 /DNA_ORIENTATION=+